MLEGTLGLLFFITAIIMVARGPKSAPPDTEPPATKPEDRTP